jgi:signal peptidase I
MEASKPRGIFSTSFIALTLGPVLVMCWLGRGRLALLYLAASFVAVFALDYFIEVGMVASRPFMPLYSTADAWLLGIGNFAGIVHGLAIRKSSLARPWFRWIAYVGVGLTVAILILALPVRTFLYRPFNVPSVSMHPNLAVGDHFFVSKFAYGYGKYSLPGGLFQVDGRTSSNTPARGDIAVFKLPRDVQIDYVMRVMGLPGDHVQIIEGVVNINGQALRQEPVQLDPVYYDKHEGISFFRETLPSGRSYVVANLANDGGADNSGVYIVPEGHFFMLGDNRDNSMDSRFGKVGTIPLENFIGRVDYRFWNSNGVPLNNRPQELP